jgi:hypothetical protein
MKIYFDLDGVLASFEGKYAELYPGVDIHDRVQFNKNVRTFAQIGFFKVLPRIEYGIKLLTELYDQGYNVEILTAVGDFDYEINAEHKRIWVYDNIPFPIEVNTVHKWFNKSLFANPDTLLIDDRQEGVDNFIEFGGNSILFAENLSVTDITNIIENKCNKP